MKSIESIKADYNLFLDIQMGKYLTGRNQKEFASYDEANLVMGMIVDAYNDKIASDHFRLDNLSKEAKISWFNSVEIDFNGVPENTDEYTDLFEKEFQKVSDNFYKVFPFLPEGSMTVLIFVGPALSAFGLPFKRFREIILGGDKPIEIEEDAILWAFDLTLAVFGSVTESSYALQDQCMKDAIEIAEEELDHKTSLSVINQIVMAMLDFFAEETPPRKNKKNTPLPKKKNKPKKK